jgi:N-acetylmuramoyl-L-alanine amidase
LTDDVKDVRLTGTDENRVYFVDFARAGEITAAPVPADPVTSRGPSLRTSTVRVIVIDPGHGGLDGGTESLNVNEKDLTLMLARKLREALQSRLGSTVLLTRDADLDMDNETRSAVANNNQADFFISLHVGYSPDKLSSDSSIFVMMQDFGGSSALTVSTDQLFLPWYLGHRTSRARSLRAARFLREELIKAVPDWTFPVRTAPLGVLASATMPSLLLEVGNINNTVNAQTLTDTAFQTRLITAIVAAVERFAESDATN